MSSEDVNPEIAPTLAVTGVSMAKQADGKHHVVLIYRTPEVQLSLDLGDAKDAMQHVPLGDQIRAVAAECRRQDLGLVQASNLDGIPSAFRRGQ